MAAPGLKVTVARLAHFARAALVLAPVVFLAAGAWGRRWMDDDGFINLRVVRNVLHGHGPVFNLGDRVEACTSPLWIGFLTLLGSIGAPLEASAVYGGIALSVAALALAIRAADLLQSPKGAQRTGIAWPIGAAIYAALPAAWDYASSGLETGLGLLWLGASYAALARILGRGTEGARGRPTYAAAALFGLGPLIRPEFALYSAVWLFPLVFRVMRPSADSKRGALGWLVRLGASAAALPFACELLRMGYYGTITPNTAIAKEAFRANWSQGGCYFRNFFGVYAMAWPGAAVAVFWLARIRSLLVDEDTVGLLVTLLPPIAGVLHVVYVVGMGGDYMHARMFLAPVFVILLPISVVRVVAPPAHVRYPLIGAGLILSSWLVVCTMKLRVNQENQCDIGDERGWYALQASVEAPIALASYRGHPFYEDGQKALTKIKESCATIESPNARREDRCHLLYFDDKDFEQLSPTRTTYPLTSNLDPRIGAAVGYGAIGIFGYMMPDDVQVIDRHGLAEPVASHLELSSRGRPGHEKSLGNAWLVARYAAPITPEDPSVAAARHALDCGALKRLTQAAHAPLTWSRFFDNVTHSFEYTRLRIPHDPFEAETKFCGTRLLPHFTTGTDGGSAFRWHCPESLHVTALVGAFNAADGVIVREHPLCGSGDVRRAEGEMPAGVPGPAFGGSAPNALPFEVACPSDTMAVGLFGTKDKVVQGLGLVCSVGAGAGNGKGGAPLRTASGGSSKGTAFELKCPVGTRVIGLEGHSGDLLDQAGIVCGP
jgi:arabinofuranosyltransferase